MATNTELSETLKKFKDAYDSANPQSVTGAQSDLSSNLLSISNQIAQAASEFRASGNDSVIDSIVANTSLAKDALDRVKSCVDADIPALLAGLAEIYSLIEGILGKVDQLNQAIADHNNAVAAVAGTTQPVPAEPAIIGQLKNEIDNDNQKGEAQIQAVKAAIDAADFGVIGNMQSGGTLGQSHSYADNYNFEWQDIYAPVTGTGPDPAGTTPPPETTPPTRLPNFDGAKEGDEVTISTHHGDDTICIPQSMREMKDAMYAGQIIVLENCRFRYDDGGTGKNDIDARTERRYFVKDSDGNYVEVDINGNKKDKGLTINPKRIWGAGDNTPWENDEQNHAWTNDTGLSYYGTRRQKKEPEQTGDVVTDISQAKPGDSYQGEAPNGNKVHNGSSSVVAEPKSMVDLKKAMENGQPIILKDVRLNYDHGQANQLRLYDGTKEPVYLVCGADGKYREVDASGKYVNDYSVVIEPHRIFEAGDNEEFKWGRGTWNPFSWGLNDTVFEDWRGGSKNKNIYAD